MNNPGKRLLMVLLLSSLLVLLSGCALQMEEREAVDLSQMDMGTDVSVPTEDGEEGSPVRVTLYFLSEDWKTLVPTVRTVTLEEGESRIHATLNALLKGPEKTEKGAYWPELGTGKGGRLLEVSNGVVTVDLNAHARTLEQETLYAVRFAIACTLLPLPEVSAVNVLVGGREEGLDLGGTLPVGTLTRVNTLDAGARYASLQEQRLSAGGVTLQTTLYFPTQDGTLLLPEVRSIRYARVAPVEYLYTILEELGKGSKLSLCERNVPAPMDYIEEMPEIVRTSDGYLAIELKMNSDLVMALKEENLTLGIYMGMLTNTLMGFVPGVEGIHLLIGGEEISSLIAEQTPNDMAIRLAQGLATRRDFLDYAGVVTTLYAAEGTGLRRIQKVLPPDGIAREQLQALMTLGEGNPLPTDLQGEDILAVYRGKEAVSVNLSRHFGTCLAACDAEQVRVAVYAMVNTLTESSQTSALSARVVFFFEGEQLGELAGGLDMRGAFVRHSGMVVNEQ